MKLQIDTKAKTIKVDETVKIVELIKVIKRLLPKEWESYSLETGSVITWYKPITWYYSSPIKWETTSGSVELPVNGSITTSVYNVECIN